MRRPDPARLARNLAYAGSGVLIVKAVEGWFAYRLVLRPDTALYVNSRSWYYPSPIGRLEGALGGVALIGWVNFAAAIALAIYAARAYGWRLTWLLALAPASLYLDVASVDTLAALALLAGLRSHRRSIAYLLLAGLIHPATYAYALPSSLRSLSRVGRAMLALFAVPVVLAFALSPYVGIVTRPGYSTLGFAVGIAAVAVPLFVVMVPGRGWRRRIVPDAIAAVLVAMPAAIEAALQHHVQVRYGLPALIVGVAAISALNGAAADPLWSRHAHNAALPALPGLSLASRPEGIAAVPANASDVIGAYRASGRPITGLPPHGAVHCPASVSDSG